MIQRITQQRKESKGFQLYQTLERQESKALVPTEEIAPRSRSVASINENQNIANYNERSQTPQQVDVISTNLSASATLQERIAALAERQSRLSAGFNSFAQKQPTQGQHGSLDQLSGVINQNVGIMQSSSPQLFSNSKTSNRRRIHKLFNEPQSTINRSSSQASSSQQDYKYFANLFGKENQKALIKELDQTLKEVKPSTKQSSLGSMEFKLAVIRKQQLKNEIKEGHQTNQLHKRQVRFEHALLPPLPPQPNSIKSVKKEIKTPMPLEQIPIQDIIPPDNQTRLKIKKYSLSVVCNIQVTQQALELQEYQQKQTPPAQPELTLKQSHQTENKYQLPDPKSLIVVSFNNQANSIQDDKNQMILMAPVAQEIEEILNVEPNDSIQRNKESIIKNLRIDPLANKEDIRQEGQSPEKQSISPQKRSNSLGDRAGVSGLSVEIPNSIKIQALQLKETVNLDDFLLEKATQGEDIPAQILEEIKENVQESQTQRERQSLKIKKNVSFKQDDLEQILEIKNQVSDPPKTASSNKTDESSQKVLKVVKKKSSKTTPKKEILLEVDQEIDKPKAAVPAYKLPIDAKNKSKVIIRQQQREQFRKLIKSPNDQETPTDY